MTATDKRIVILDRDGVINADSPDYIKSPDEWHVLPGSAEAIAALTQQGVDIYVVTNQSGIGRGLFSEATYQDITNKMIATVEAAGGKLADVIHCPDTPEKATNRRKPKPGMFFDVARLSGQDLAGVYAIGDSLRDLEAGAAAGCTPVLVLTGNGAKTLQKIKDGSLQIIDNKMVFENLASAVERLFPAGDTQ